MEIKGEIIAVLPLKSGISQATGNKWQVQEYVIKETGKDYPQSLKFEVFGDKVESFSIVLGEALTVSFDVSAREYKGAYYNTARAYKVEREISQQPQAQQIPQQAPIPPFVAQSSDDLPF